MSTSQHQPLVDRVLNVMGDTPKDREFTPTTPQQSTDTLVNFFIEEHSGYGGTGIESLREHITMLVDIAMRAERMIAVGQVRRLSRQFNLESFGSIVEAAILRGGK